MSTSSGPRANWRCRPCCWRDRCWRCSTRWTAGTGAHEQVPAPTAREPLAVDGALNFLLIAGVVGEVLLSGLWKPDVSFDIAGTPLELQNLDARRRAGRGWRCCRSGSRRGRYARRNAFNWAPIAEVAKLFAGIFLTIIPVIAMLQAGGTGALGASRRPGDRQHDRRAAPHHVLLDDRLAVRIPRQRADLPRVLQPRRWRRDAG